MNWDEWLGNKVVTEDTTLDEFLGNVQRRHSPGCLKVLDPYEFCSSECETDAELKKRYTQ